MATKKQVKISLKQKNDGRWKLVIDPVDIWIKTTGEEPTWLSDDADVKASFNKGANPFSATNIIVPAGTEVGAGTPIQPNQGKYDYTLTITPKPPIPIKNYGTMPPIVIDPQVVIDDVGPPGGGRRGSKKKGAKKKATKKGASKSAASKKSASRKRARRKR